MMRAPSTKLRPLATTINSSDRPHPLKSRRGPRRGNGLLARRDTRRGTQGRDADPSLIARAEPTLAVRASRHASPWCGEAVASSTRSRIGARAAPIRIRRLSDDNQLFSRTPLSRRSRRTYDAARKAPRVDEVRQQTARNPPLNWREGDDDANIRALVETSVEIARPPCPGNPRRLLRLHHRSLPRWCGQSPFLMKCLEYGLPLKEVEGQARGAERLKEAFSSTPFYAERAKKDPDYWHKLVLESAAVAGRSRERARLNSAVASERLRTRRQRQDKTKVLPMSPE